jgi:hypothetical protein
MARNGTVDRIETAANITLVVSKGANQGVSNFDGSYEGTEDQPSGYLEIPISRLDTTKEVEMNEVRESSLKASGYAITAISYSGTMMFKGSKVTKTYANEGSENSVTKDITDFLYDEHGVPMPVTINIDHGLTGENEIYRHVLVNSESYEVRSESETETAFDWVAMDRDGDQPDQ